MYVAVLYYAMFYILQAAADLLSSIEASGASGSSRLCEYPPRNKVQGIVFYCSCVYMCASYICMSLYTYACTLIGTCHVHVAQCVCIVYVGAFMESLVLPFFNRNWMMRSGSWLRTVRSSTLFLLSRRYMHNFPKLDNIYACMHIYTHAL